MDRLEKSMICDDTNRRAIDHQHPTDGRWFQVNPPLYCAVTSWRTADLKWPSSSTNGLFSLDRDNNIVQQHYSTTMPIGTVSPCHSYHQRFFCPDNNNLTDQNFLLLDLECCTKCNILTPNNFRTYRATGGSRIKT